MKFKGKKLLWGAKFLGMMLPAEATFIPVYYFYSKLGLVDNWIGLILPSLVAMFGIFMFKNAFESIPSEVMEAARMDKAKNRTIMLKIMVPMIAPVLITHLITSFISNWNEYYWVLVMTNSEKLRTLPVVLRGLLQVDEGVCLLYTSIRCTTAARLAFLFVPTEEIIAVTQVPIFCPIMMGIAAA